jgi:7-cyano-7-deazaguanine reductase
MAEQVLGQTVAYPTKYSPDILFKIKRSEGRKNINSDVEFFGIDIWNCYEISWINSKGKPEVRILEIYIPSTSEFLVESKSLKLYFFSLNNEKFDSEEVFKDLVKKDLESLLICTVHLELKKIQDYKNYKLESIDAISIDDIDISPRYTQPSQDIIKYKGEIAEETLYSNLHKTNCLITSQPDWATLIISYKGLKIDHSSLLEYIISFRNEDMFHEHSVEKILSELLSSGKFEKLTVYARYTRRGGIDINPIRSTEPISITEAISLNHRMARQ